MAQRVKNLPATQKTWIQPLGQKDPWRNEWLPTPLFLPGEFHGEKSLAGYSPWACKNVRHDWATNTHGTIFSCFCNYICVCVCVCVCVQHTQTHSSVLVCVLVAQPCPLFVTPWIIAFQLLCPWNSPGKNTGVGCHFLHQGFFLTQGLRIAGIAIPGIAFQADSLPSEPPEKPW